MPEPIYLLILVAWAPPLVFALARLGFGRYGVVTHAVAALATYPLAYASMRLWLAPLREPSAAQAFAPVATIMNRVDYWWVIVLFEQAWPVPATFYFGLCWLLALPFALQRRQRQRAAQAAEASRPFA